ncbi:MAG: alpha/beta hydrolase-fold protein [Fuerstiella sp.]
MDAQTLRDGWSQQILAGRPTDVFVPKTVMQPKAAVLFLHGHGGIGLTANEVFTELLEQHGLAAICPAGAQAWWLDHVCTDFDPNISPMDWIVEQLLPVIETEFGITERRTALLGVSMGGQGALQMAYRHPLKFPIVAAISPAIDFHQLHGMGLPLDQIFANSEDARQATAVLNLNPMNWPRHQWFCCDPSDVDWIDGNRRLAMKLSSSGILHERHFETTFDDPETAHSWTYFNAVAKQAFGHISSGLGKL